MWLSRGELIAGGSGLALLVVMFLPWYGVDVNVGGFSTSESGNAWEVFSTLDWLLVAACAAPFILTWIVARGHSLTWKPGEVTMIVGIVAFVLILCNGIILGRPGDSVDIGLGIGYFVGLLGSVGMLGAGYLRQAFYTTARKPPGVI